MRPIRPHVLPLLILATLLAAGGPPVRAEDVGDAPRPPSDEPPRTAPAPGPPRPWEVGVSPERRTAAFQHYRRGNAYFEQRQYSSALKEYRVAVSQWDHPAIRYNMAVALINLDQWIEAWESLERSLRWGAGPLKAHGSQARTYQRLLLGRLGRLRIVCALPGARVTLDGQPVLVGPGEATRLVVAGRHEVTASHAEHLPDSRQVLVAPGEVTPVRLSPRPLTEAVVLTRRFGRPWMPWLVLAAGAAVAAAGIPLLVLSETDYRRFNRDFSAACPDGCATSAIPASMLARRDRARAERASGAVLASLGLLALSAGSVLAGLNAPRAVRAPGAGPRRVTLMPEIVPGGLGLSATLRF